MKTVLFHRHFARFAGHHLKVWDYFNHVEASPGHTAFVRFTTESRLDDTNPWMAVPNRIIDPAARFVPDVLFLSGMDWRRIEPDARMSSPIPVINLVQHPTHFDPQNPRYELLRNKAIRICISHEVAEAVEATGRAHGPIFTLPTGLDVASVVAAAKGPERNIDILIAGLKNPSVGSQVAASLDGGGRTIHLISEHLRHRSEFLSLLGRAKVTIFLPWQEEGFYMPALEGMAAGTVVVCPDAFGNRSFCLHEVNCFRPPYEPDAIRQAAEHALSQLPQLGEMTAEAARTAERHDRAHERAGFLRILERAEQLWGEIGP